MTSLGENRPQQDSHTTALQKAGTRWNPVTRPLIKEFSLVALGQSCSLLAAAASVKVLASQLGPSEYGQLALGMTVPLLLNQLVFGPLGLAAVRHYAPCRESGSLLTLVLSVKRFSLRFGAVATATATALALASRLVFGGAWPLLLLLMVLFGLAQNIQATVNSLQVAGRSRLSAAFYQAMEPSARLVFGVAALLISRRASAVAAGFLVGVCIVCVSQIRSFERQLPPGVIGDPRDSTIAHELYQFGKFVAIWGLFTFGQLASDRWVLKAFCGDATVGVYAVGLQLATVTCVTVPSMIGQFTTPIIFEQAGDASDPRRIGVALRTIRATAIANTVWVIVGTLLAIALGAQMVDLIASREYVEVARYLPLIVLGLGSMQVGHSLGLVPMVAKRMRSYTALKVLHCTIAIALNVACAWRWQLAGVCLSVAVSGLLYPVIIALNNARITRQIGSMQPA